MQSGLKATLIALPLVLIALSLGVWQLQRLQWKEKLLADIAAGMAAPAVTWQSATIPPEFTHVMLNGVLVSAAPLYVYGRTMDGAAGVHIFSAIVPDTGPAVIVDLGFLPLPVEAARTVGFNGKIEGIVRHAPGKAWFENDNDAGKNEWFWPDLPAMGQAMGLTTVAPVYVEATTAASANGPQPTGQLILGNIRNDHLQYALTWFSLAGILVVIYAVSLRQGRRL